jgi:hypothetical protein
MFPLFAQTVRVPFVGCASDGQTGPMGAPQGVNQDVRIAASAVRRLAYYKAAVAPGVLAPRGWYCFGIYGSSGAELLISPRPIEHDEVFSSNWHGSAGPAVQIDWTQGGGSGTATAAQVWARVFPAYWPIIKGLINNGDLPAADYTFGPYPGDNLIVQTDRLVQFRTASHSEGLGTMSRLKPDEDPIDGFAMLQGKNPDLLTLRVRLSREQHDLAPVIIQDLLLRERRDTR